MLAAFVLLFVPAWFSRGPWHVDDLRYVEAARQMGEYGDWLVPSLNGDVYGEKPPGYRREPIRPSTSGIRSGVLPIPPTTAWTFV